VFKSIRIGAPRSALVAAGVFAEESTLPDALGDLDQAAGGALSQALKTPGFRAEPGEVVSAGEKHVLVGLGARDELDLGGLRIVGARLMRALDRIQPKAVELAIGECVPEKVGAPDAIAQAIAEGMALANWRVDFFDGEATQHDPALPELVVKSHDRAYRDGLQRGLMLADSTNYARRLAATPPNICSPEFIAKEARRLARETGLTCKVISFAEAKKMNMGGLVNVGKASEHKPCLVQLDHKPQRVAKKAKGETIVLVGKTITYDTGGYSIKSRDGMKGMKYDKNGGMAVLGAMHAIAMLKLPVRVTGLLPAAENMVSGEAYRPDDIITMYNGVTVEVTNTDAEGRLVLADALAYACDKVKPTAIVDIATLTGGVVTALGSWSAGVWCNDEPLKTWLFDAADRSGERLWELPLWKEHRDFMRAKHADVWNSAPKREAHPIQGAAFLSYFVDEEIPWAHVDIAGTNAVDSDTDLYVTGPTGYGVRLLTELVASYVSPH